MKRKLLLSAAGLAVSVLPPLLAVISYFPIWRERGSGAVLSGFGALLLVMCAAPILKLLRRALSSPSAWTMWLVSFLMFYTLSGIAREMTVISLVGLVSGLVGAVLFRIARRADE